MKFRLEQQERGSVQYRERKTIRKKRLRKQLLGIFAGLVFVVFLCLLTVNLIVNFDTQTLEAASGSTFEKETAVASVSDFPESYQTALKAIKKAYPNAVLIKYETNLEWSDAFTSSNLLYPGRNVVIDNSSTPSSWKMTANGYFNWKKNEWVATGYINDGTTKVVTASKDATAYYFDPRTYLTTDTVFAFETQAFDANAQTVSGVKAIIKGTFMENVKIKVYDANGNATGKSVLYAQAIYDIGKKTGVSPYLIAVRIRQEQGTEGSSSLISGKVASPYTGLYNYLNVETYDDTDINQVIINGMIEAQNGSDFDNDTTTANVSWTSPYLAIWGGAIKLGEKYVCIGRSNLYLQKFDVVQRYTGDGTAYRDYYGYEGYLLGAETQAKSMYNSYVNDGTITVNSSGTPSSSTAFVFEIPVYNNMPETASEKPTKDGNPNYKLASIKLGDDTYSIGTFNTDTTEYSTIVPYSYDSILVKALPYADTSTLKLNGTKMTVGSALNSVYNAYWRSGKVELAVGSNTIKIQDIAENGDKRTYTITIVRQEQTEEQVVGNPQLTSDTYTIGSKYISNITVGTTVKSFIKNFTITNNGSMKVLSADGEALSTSSKIATGMQVQLLDANSKVYQTYEVVIYGDTNGDGEISSRDMIAIKRHYRGSVKLKGAYLEAGDTNNDDTVSSRDMIAVKRHYRGSLLIEQR